MCLASVVRTSSLALTMQRVTRPIPLLFAPVAACVLSAALVSFGLSRSVVAQHAYPLPVSAGNTTPTEATAPFLLPSRCVQTKIADRLGLVASQGLQGNLGVWDMVAMGPNSRFVFVPCESDPGGLFRFDTVTGNATVLLAGNGLGRTVDPANWVSTNDNYARLDPATLTSWGSILTAEEEDGGRLFEVMNPYSSPPFQTQWRTSIPSVRHEGLRFGDEGILYFVDESSSGSIYKFVPVTPGDLSSGQSFVLSVDAFANDPNAQADQNWNSASNVLTTRLGAATWLPLTDAQGIALTVANPFAYVTVSGGRDAADELAATPFGRPEDLAVRVLANGNQCLQVALSAEHAVLSIELVTATSALVRHLVDRTTPDLATGQAISSEFSWPDNLAVDAFGVVYVVEDYSPGDIFKVVDADRDGVAEAVGRVLSCGVAGAEPSGLIFDPNDPYRMILTVMHPTSGNDALWAIQTRPYPGHGDPYLRLVSGVSNPLSFGPGEFVATAIANDVVTFAVDPTSALLGNQFGIFIQPFVTSVGIPAYLPPLWVNPQLSMVLTFGSVGTLPSAPPYGGNAISVQVPAGLQGLSILAQGVVLNPAVGLVLSDGVELILQ
ncbi:MAG: hypothetical protein ACI91B_001540 [Planctomycetota bacterium]|jgi:hypothetical protein